MHNGTEQEEHLSLFPVLVAGNNSPVVAVGWCLDQEESILERVSILRVEVLCLE